jgi:hypothetical protein
VEQGTSRKSREVEIGIPIVVVVAHGNSGELPRMRREVGWRKLALPITTKELARVTHQKDIQVSITVHVEKCCPIA